MNYDRDQSGRSYPTHEYESLPLLGERPGLQIFPIWQAVAVAIGGLVLLTGLVAYLVR